MNTLNGTISAIKTSGSLSLITVNVSGIKLTSIVIDTPETVSYLQEENPVKVVFKETEVVIGKGDNHQISLQNRIAGEIVKVDKAELLTKVTINSLAGKITSIITTNAVEQLKLKEGDRVEAMIKTNEIMLSE